MALACVVCRQASFFFLRTDMASSDKPTTTTPGKGVFLAFALHLYAWFIVR